MTHRHHKRPRSPPDDGRTSLLDDHLHKMLSPRAHASKVDKQRHESDASQSPPGVLAAPRWHTRAQLSQQLYDYWQCTLTTMPAALQQLMIDYMGDMIVCTMMYVRDANTGPGTIVIVDWNGNTTETVSTVSSALHVRWEQPLKEADHRLSTLDDVRRVVCCRVQSAARGWEQPILSYPPPTSVDVKEAPCYEFSCAIKCPFSDGGDIMLVQEEGNRAADVDGVSARRIVRWTSIDRATGRRLGSCLVGRGDSYASRLSMGFRDATHVAYLSAPNMITTLEWPKLDMEHTVDLLQELQAMPPMPMSTGYTPTPTWSNACTASVPASAWITPDVFVTSHFYGQLVIYDLKRKQRWLHVANDVRQRNVALSRFFYVLPIRNAGRNTVVTTLLLPDHWSLSSGHHPAIVYQLIDTDVSADPFMASSLQSTSGNASSSAVECNQITSLAPTVKSAFDGTSDNGLPNNSSQRYQVRALCCLDIHPDSDLPTSNAFKVHVDCPTVVEGRWLVCLVSDGRHELHRRVNSYLQYRIWDMHSWSFVESLSTFSPPHVYPCSVSPIIKGLAPQRVESFLAYL